MSNARSQSVVRGQVLTGIYLIGDTAALPLEDFGEIKFTIISAVVL